MIEAFEHGDLGTAEGAALTIGTFGTEAESAVPTLTAALDDPERRTAAADALRGSRAIAIACRLDATTWFAAGVGDVRDEQTDTVTNDELASGRFIVELMSIDEL